MALALYIVVIYIITSVRTEELPEDITKILEGVIEQIEAARRNKENQDNPIGLITQADSQIFYMKTKSDPNDSKKMAETLPMSVDKKEGESHTFPSYLQQNLDTSNTTNSDNGQAIGSLQNESKSLIFHSPLDDYLNILESGNTYNLSSIERTLKSDDSTINPQALEHTSVDEIVSQLSGRRANLDNDIDDTKAIQPDIIIDQNARVDRFHDEKKSNNLEIARMPINTTDFYSTPTEFNLKQLNKNFEKLFKKIKEIKKLHKMEEKQKIVSQLSGRRANLDNDIDDTKAIQPDIIIDQNARVDRFHDEKKSNNLEIARMPINTTDFYSTPTEFNLKQLNKNFEKLFKKIKEIKKLHKMEEKQKLDRAIEPQYRSTLQRDLNKARKPLSKTSKMVPPIAEPLIVIKRTPWLQQPYYPQNINMFLKPPLDVVQHLIKRSYPSHGYQVRPALVPRIRKVILRQFPVLVDKVPKILWSSL